MAKVIDTTVTIKLRMLKYFITSSVVDAIVYVYKKVKKLHK